MFGFDVEMLLAGYPEYETKEDLELLADPDVGVITQAQCDATIAAADAAAAQTTA